jgi:hypothetical protein
MSIKDDIKRHKCIILWRNQNQWLRQKPNRNKISELVSKCIWKDTNISWWNKEKNKMRKYFLLYCSKAIIISTVYMKQKFRQVFCMTVEMWYLALKKMFQKLFQSFTLKNKAGSLRYFITNLFVIYTGHLIWLVQWSLGGCSGTVYRGKKHI